MTIRRTLPTRRPNETIETTWNWHLITVTIGYDMTGFPREVFANTSRGGDIAAALSDACVLISIALQYGISHETLAKSLGRMPDLQGGTIPASPIGVILEIVAKHGTEEQPSGQVAW